MGCTVNELNTGKIAALSFMKEFSSYLTEKKLQTAKSRDQFYLVLILFLCLCSCLLLQPMTGQTIAAKVSKACVRTQNSIGRIGGG
jgi:hypothetical protein